MNSLPVEKERTRTTTSLMGIVDDTMSTHQWPPPQSNGGRPTPPEQSPWAQPDARWSPQSYRDAQGRDPRQPFGQPEIPTQAPDIDQFEPPRQVNRKTLAWGAAIVAAIAALLLVLQFTGGFAPSEPAASPSPDTPQSPEPVATSGTSIPFEGNGRGVFEILSQEWTDTGLTVRYRITLNEGEGERSFALYMFTNTTLEVADPTNYELATAASGEPFTGTAEFSVIRAESTLVLASGFGSALTALPIPG